MTKELKIKECKFSHLANDLEESRQAGFVFTNPDYNTTVGYEVKLDQDTNEPYAIMYYNNIKCDVYGTAFNRFRLTNWQLAPIVWTIAVKTIYDNPTIHPNKMAAYIHQLAQMTELTSIPTI